MRLQSLKLAGFKSFAEPVTLRFASPLTAIVGPNGCGKSNVIDAVKWVMGESSARQLRGGQMADVIFAGSQQRKPASQASVELVFENTLGRLGGDYRGYTEIAIRRVIFRDGRSGYYLNGQKCRRKDIVNIFLGTGLGSRSYAVIQQGMINRLIEAGPDDLRAFIEEAAGVSRYQARRRETLQHLEHAATNVLRLEDVYAELEKQQRVLKKQGQAAEKYLKLKEESVRLEYLVLTGYQHYYTAGQQQLRTRLEQQRSSFGAVRQQQQTIQKELILLGKTSVQLQQHYATVQNEHQQQLTAMTRTVTELEYAQRDYDQGKSRLQKLSGQKDDSIRQRQQLAAQISDLSHELAGAPPATDLGRLQAELEQAGPAQTALGQTLARQREVLQERALNTGKIEQKLDHLARQIRQEEQRQAQLQQQIYRQKKNDLDARQVQLVQQLGRLEQDTAKRQQQLLQLDQQLGSMKTVQATLSGTVTSQKEKVDRLSHEIEMLQRLLVQPSTPVAANTQTLLHMLELTEEGQAHVTLVEQLLGWLFHLPVVEDGQQTDHDSITCGFLRPEKLPVLQSGQHTLDHWIRTPSLSIFRAIMLAPQADTTGIDTRSWPEHLYGILTLDGYLVFRSGQVNLGRLAQGRAQSLQHKVRLAACQAELELDRPRLEQLETELAAHLHTAQDTRTQHEQLQRLQSTTAREQALLQGELSGIEREQAQQQQFLQQYEEDLRQIELRLGYWTEEQGELQLELAMQQQQRDRLRQEVDALQQQHDTGLQQFRHLGAEISRQQEAARSYQLQLQQRQTRLQLLEQQTARLQEDIASIEQQQEQLVHYQLKRQQAVEQLEADAARLQSQAETGRQDLLQLESEVNGQRLRSEQLAAEEKQLAHELEVLGNRIHALELQQGEIRLKLEMVEKGLEQPEMQASQFSSDLVNTFSEKVDDALLEFLQQQEQLLAASRQSLAQMTDVNLGAGRAWQEVSERLETLSHQLEDIRQTETQLQAAISTIDQESGLLFRQTFDAVNSRFQILFPKVFSGGNAALQLMDNGGVSIMAQPPGKKNTSISLLSGGEKTLTALAFVFAIFHLNPAPFCMLDEVDAPLDDANVRRFGNLVQELSSQVQFIYISHNKLAMSLANDLLGITMPEPGASRLVSVNLEQAATYIE